MLLSVTGGLAVLVLVRRAVRRLGGVTGDVLGAAVEVALAMTLLTWAALWSPPDVGARTPGTHLAALPSLAGRAT